MPAQCRLRLGRRSFAGQVYLVTFTTFRRVPHFADPALATTAARLLADRAVWSGAALLAWVLMPDHWHGVVSLGGASLSRTIGALKGRSARRLRDAHPRVGRVWDRGFHDRALRKDEALRDMARYVVMNPVRAGLVPTVGAYPFWDAVWLGGGKLAAEAAPTAGDGPCGRRSV